MFVDIKQKALLKKFEESFEAYTRKQSPARFQEAENILNELTTLVITGNGNADAIQTISKNRERLSAVQPISIDPQEEEKQPEILAHTEPYLLLDPFNERAKIPSNFIHTIDDRLQILLQNIGTMRDALQLEGFKDIWRIRVGKYRILYTVLQEKKAVGIIAIDQRKDVYKDVTIYKQRALWFNQLDKAPVDEIFKEIQQAHNVGKHPEERAFIELYLKVTPSNDQQHILLRNRLQKIK